MYLTQLREMDVRHNHWPGQSDVFMLNHCFDIADATLNSWKEAHDAFGMRIEKVNDPKYISYGVHYAFTRLVHRAFKDEEDFSIRSFATNRFPSECIAYALLVLWLERAAADKPAVGTTVRSKCGRHRTTYQPDWSPSKPWATFHSGTACNAFATLEQAKHHLQKDHGAEFEDSP